MLARGGDGGGGRTLSEICCRSSCGLLASLLLQGDKPVTSDPCLLNLFLRLLRAIPSKDLGTLEEESSALPPLVIHVQPTQARLSTKGQPDRDRQGTVFIFSLRGE